MIIFSVILLFPVDVFDFLLDRNVKRVRDVLASGNGREHGLTKQQVSRGSGPVLPVQSQIHVFGHGVSKSRLLASGTRRIELVPMNQLIFDDIDIPNSIR